MARNEAVTFWHVPKPDVEKGNGERIDGKVRGGKSSVPSFANRIDTTIGKMIEHRENITQGNVRVNFRDVLMTIPIDRLDEFLADPCRFTMTNVEERFAK